MLPGPESGNVRRQALMRESEKYRGTQQAISKSFPLVFSTFSDLRMVGDVIHWLGRPSQDRREERFSVGETSKASLLRREANRFDQELS